LFGNQARVAGMVHDMRRRREGKAISSVGTFLNISNDIFLDNRRGAAENATT